MAQNISKFVPEIYSKKLLRDAKQITDFKNVMCNFDWEGEIKNFGDTVRICSPNADLVQIGEGVVPNPTNVVPNQLTLVIDKTKNFMFYFNDIEQAQSQFKMMEGYMNIGLQKLSDEISKELQAAVLAATGKADIKGAGKCTIATAPVCMAADADIKLVVGTAACTAGKLKIGVIYA